LIAEHGEEVGNRMFDSAKKNFEMHHTYNDGAFELVDKDVHRAFGHSGGNKLSKTDGVVLGVAGALTPNWKDELENAANGKDTNLPAAFAADVLTAIDPVADGATLKMVVSPSKETFSNFKDGLWQAFKDSIIQFPEKK